MKLAIDAMHCGGCVRSVTRAVQKLDPAASVAADLDAKRVEVDTARRPEEIVAALDAAGFPAVVVAA
ncbi:heavy-metal-associated domain-containing protein [Antarcticirhabdus aurantiaca]|uniref:Heavy-metal-associated domain-containing protein n=1 Tax=Antarcticirhabdus aurantiaca TaxID=2606717 RepID=A0ACD4NPK6_9HYPH|nr:heavy-metal-associated domain-containing protein [Antarcticirhabdus aurantiaca]WAJ28755.1 heavy-metal-associated domain-containing protein [Jeongeuplla avenae]